MSSREDYHKLEEKIEAIGKKYDIDVVEYLCCLDGFVEDSMYSLTETELLEDIKLFNKLSEDDRISTFDIK
jgi:hypothetical protein